MTPHSQALYEAMMLAMDTADHGPLPKPLVAQPKLAHPYDRIESVELRRDDVSHWSTSMYGNIPTGHIHVHRFSSPNSGAVDRSRGQVISLGLDTPGGKAPSGIHGGARRIDIGLTPAQAERLAYMLLRAAQEEKD